ncbi:MAG: BatD family protein [Paludibacteraceae bacterium]|nr:BatD family protein [Paludibacteraceae bacterium]
MKTLKAIALTFIFLLSTCLSAIAAEISFVAKAENVVTLGEKVLIMFTLNNAESDNINFPSLEGFKILYGPNKSTNSSMSIINGHREQSYSTTWTYYVTPEKEGTFTISPAKATVSGTVYRTNALTIKVIKGEDKPANSGNQNAQQNTTASISNDDVFLRTEISKSKVYEQEQFIATLKLYYRVNINSLEDYKLPEYKGFISQDIEVPNENKYGKENVNGKVYNTLILKQNVLIPQKSGQLDLGKGSVTALAQVQVNSQRGGWPFDGFFTQTRLVQKTLNIPNVSVNVQPLPDKNKPENFNGAVGSFQISSSKTPTEGYKTNEAITIKLKIQGSGNIKFAKAPKINFPEDFETYDPKIDNSIKASENGISGTKTIEYLAIPRYPGEYVIPAAEFSFFDVKTKSYKKLKTEEYKLTIEKGADVAASTVSNYTNKESVKYSDSDIKYINQKNYSLSPRNEYFYGSLAYALWFIIPLVLFVVVFFFLRKLAAENSNIALVKNKKANKLATKRFKAAKEHMDKDNKSGFYEEISKALYGYVSDKMNISATELTKNNVKTELSSHNVSEETTNEFIKMLDTCEFARFAPSAVSSSMQDIYNEAVDLVGKLENEITAVNLQK